MYDLVAAGRKLTLASHHARRPIIIFSREVEKAQPVGTRQRQKEEHYGPDLAAAGRVICDHRVNV